MTVTTASPMSPAREGDCPTLGTHLQHAPGRGEPGQSWVCIRTCSREMHAEAVPSSGQGSPWALSPPSPPKPARCGDTIYPLHPQAALASLGHWQPQDEFPTW